MLDSRAKLMMNALRKWGVLLPDKLICEMDDKQFEKWYHQHRISIFLEMGNLRSLYTSNRKLCRSFTLSQDPIFQKKIC